MQFDAAINHEEGNEDCADECDDSSNLFWNSDCTEEVKICCGGFSCSNRSIFVLDDFNHGIHRHRVSLFCLAVDRWAPTMAAEQPLHVDTQHVCEHIEVSKREIQQLTRHRSNDVVVSVWINLVTAGDDSIDESLLRAFTCDVGDVDSHGGENLSGLSGLAQMQER